MERAGTGSESDSLPINPLLWPKTVLFWLLSETAIRLATVPSSHPWLQDDQWMQLLMRCKAEEWSVSEFASSMHGNSKISDCICEDDAMGLALHQLHRERRSALCLIDSGWQKISRHEYSVLILQTCLGIGRALKRQFRSDGERKDLGLNFWSPCMTLMLILLRSFWIKDPLFFSIYVDYTTQSTRTMHSLHLPQEPHATLRGQGTEPHPFPITNRPLTVLGGVWM